jgi:NAD(P)-dependent dehydrogenase (short-subunit alcohol dehydrogenase family)
MRHHILLDKIMTNPMHSLFDLTGHIALCTGGSSGIGKRMAWALMNAGAKVILVARSEKNLAQAKTEFTSQSGMDESVATIAADLSDRSCLGDIVSTATDIFGAPDILINAAGINLRQAADDITDETWDQTLNINLSTPFFLARHCSAGMKQKGSGRIINIASLQSYRAFPNSMPYGASKGGITQLTRAMAENWSADGIMANAIAPGFFPTELTKAVYENPEMLAHNASMTAIGRNGELADLDGTTIFLASRASSYVTGQVIAVDGGFTAK